MSGISKSKVKAKGNVHQHCTLVDKAVSFGAEVKKADIQLYRFTRSERLSTWMVNVGSQVSPLEVRGHRQARGEA